MDLFVRGVNFSIPHGLWYNPKQVYISPLVSPYSEKIAPALPAYSDFVGRSCMLLQGGKRVADIGLFYPFEELAGWYRFEDPDNPRQGFFISPETDYQKISGMLTNQVRQDFTFIHPEFFLDKKYSIKDGSVTLDNKENKQNYKVLIVSGCKIISYKTLSKIRDFYQQGGLVISTTQLPFKASEMGEDQKVIDLIEEIFGINSLELKPAKIHSNANKNGGKAIFIPNPNPSNLSKAMQTQLVADVRFSPNPTLGSDMGKFSYIHKIKEGKDIYYFTNSSNETIETEVILKGKINLKEGNPHNGTLSKIEKIVHFSENGQPFTKCKLKLEPVSSLFWIGRIGNE